MNCREEFVWDIEEWIKCELWRVVFVGYWRVVLL